MKRKVTVFTVFALLLLLTACKAVPKNEYTKYTDSFFDTFNTVTVVVGYAKSEDEFNTYFEQIHEDFQVLHKLYDKYNNYAGINNIKTINDHAGVKPVKVDKPIIDLIVFSKEWHGKTRGLTNIAFGSVLEIWHDYRIEGIDNPQNAELPPMEILQNATTHTDMDKVIVDIENSTVYLADSHMRLDVGAIAKGYATEIVAKEISQAGMTSGIISSGGNVRAIGKPLDGMRQRWGIGVQDPNSSILSDDQNLDVVFITDASVVNSGDYQRYYKVGNQLFHHLIDPETLMPATHYRAVTVVTENSGVADFLSTELFLLPYEESHRLVEGLDGVEAIWVMPNGKVESTDGMKKIMRSYGASDR
ncbi:thiamine biosynthesis lipoprotein [Anaerovirgula multivorans]|uniref:FAD:protein FMN transferase n=1 Tax=Anaerovirgula multivorans TaxID=312168 RepID=A0A239FS00_9FIRM|nr:FAD:protein FMN transferase [Anaerovirgula multivorans]SNS59701.1 thiamine biosynthesis lipoprotein [Anaerovirgula multivorans]